MNEYSLFKKIIDFVKINESVSREHLLGWTAKIVGVQRTHGYPQGINAVIDLILLSGLLKQDGDSICAAEVSEFGKPPIEKVTPIHIERAPSVQTSFPITITINVGEDTSTEKIKAIMKIVKEVFEERLNKDRARVKRGVFRNVRS